MRGLSLKEQETGWLCRLCEESPGQGFGREREGLGSLQAAAGTPHKMGPEGSNQGWKGTRLVSAASQPRTGPFFASVLSLYLTRARRSRALDSTVREDHRSASDHSYL